MSKPSPISASDVRHVAKLSRLSLSDDEVATMTDQLGSILSYIQKLSELDVEGVEPMAHPLDLTNALREDVEEPGLATDRALMNAPASDPPFFEVPKVLGDGSSA
ncbi:Asp-tRNA(Asn)/Glu-tRNA(Gln) amidotransferase subunit GatC [Mucisphaera calidilacus]|uniref:Aspartyl/glutamyl-tRNA(Asn/Gln) amidotransferase subunit C n=1 Tax=Mucisphaera calidilacus TaxID=2527982 RepID=A0A518BXY8_9BACT|nr:Asp-tRNA(Asn)/Glu-tRNA(Gln) amidotransferase subunit GatC [Mucisphaera calidilacus]QDU71845.1 Glutamyl-tRNA(Gln) amidotransferase subunit C [Mucisphaera calidilacus]